MNLNSLDFNILKHLFYLIQEKNVSNAAKKAGITQSAMSKSLKKIRDVFEDEILIDNGTGYGLTEKALLLKPKIEELLKTMNSILHPCTENISTYLYINRSITLLFYYFLTKSIYIIKGFNYVD